nr:YegP family protein [Acinetobacter sp. Marseille-Q1620]
MSGWYEVSQAKDGQYKFVLKAGNGEIILTSELYKAKASAQNGIESVQKNSADDARYERLVAKNGKPYFNLKAANHQIIGTSQFYTSEQSRDHGIDSVKNNGSSQTIKDLTT